MNIGIIEEIKQLDFEDIKTMHTLLIYFKKWLEANKYYDFKFMQIDIRNSFDTSDVIVIDNLWKECGAKYTIHNGEELLEDVSYLLYDWLECRDFNNEDLDFFNEFWEEKVSYLTSLSSPFLNGKLN